MTFACHDGPPLARQPGHRIIEDENGIRFWQKGMNIVSEIHRMIGGKVQVACLRLNNRNRVSACERGEGGECLSCPPGRRRDNEWKFGICEHPRGFFNRFKRRIRR